MELRIELSQEFIDRNPDEKLGIDGTTIIDEFINLGTSDYRNRILYGYLGEEKTNIEIYKSKGGFQILSMDPNNYVYKEDLNQLEFREM